jgi:hypothetical protein
MVLPVCLIVNVMAASKMLAVKAGKTIDQP